MGSPFRRESVARGAPPTHDLDQQDISTRPSGETQQQFDQVSAHHFGLGATEPQCLDASEFVTESFFPEQYGQPVPESVRLLS